MTAKRKTEEKRESFSDLIHPIHNYTKSKFCIIWGSGQGKEVRLRALGQFCPKLQAAQRYKIGVLYHCFAPALVGARSPGSKP